MPIQGLELATQGLWKDYTVSDSSDAKWKQILDLVGQRLAAISTSAGYKTDIGTNVFWDRPTDLQESECPGIVYYAESVNPEEGPIGSFRWTMLVTINVITMGTTGRAEVTEAVTDILSVLKTNRTWDSLATTTGFPSVTPKRTQQVDKIFAGAAVSVPITFDTEQWAI